MIAFSPQRFSRYAVDLFAAVLELSRERHMSITGIKPGDVKAMLQKVKDRQAGSLQKVADLASKSETVAQAMDAITSVADKELDTALAELGQFSNLGPDLNDTPIPAVGPYPLYHSVPTKTGND